MKLSQIPRRIVGVIADFVRDEPFLVGLAATAASEYAATQLGASGQLEGLIQGAVLIFGLNLVRKYVTPVGGVDDRIAKSLESLVYPPLTVPLPGAPTVGLSGPVPFVAPDTAPAAPPVFEGDPAPPVVAPPPVDVPVDPVPPTNV